MYGDFSVNMLTSLKYFLYDSLSLISIIIPIAFFCNRKIELL
jgi:hypothetical protein